MKRSGELEARSPFLAPDDPAVLRLEARKLEPDRIAGLQVDVDPGHEALDRQVLDLGGVDRRARLAKPRGEVDDTPLGRAPFRYGQDRQLSQCHSILSCGSHRL